MVVDDCIIKEYRHQRLLQKHLVVHLFEFYIHSFGWQHGHLLSGHSNICSQTIGCGCNYGLLSLKSARSMILGTSPNRYLW